MSTITFTRHVPLFIEWDDDETIPTLGFEHLDELLDYEFVKRFSTQWSDGKMVKSKEIILWYINEEKWFILGTVDKPDQVDVPSWTPPEYCKWLDTR